MTQSAYELGAAGFELKAAGDEGEIEGYASMFGQIDKGRDIVVKGAFLDTLKDRPAKAVKMLFQHDPHEPIGVWNDIREDEKGLYAKGRLLTDTQRGKEVHTMIRAGAVDGLSIGYRTSHSRFDSAKKARLIEKASLWEISVVTFPLLETARISAVKSFNPRELEGALRDAGISRADAVKAVGIFRKSLQCDAGEPEESQREAAADLLANIRRLDSIIGG